MASHNPRTLAVLAFAACVAAAVPAGAQQAIFLARHAERLDNSTDSPLSVEGRAHAERLARMLRDARITAIYVTEFQRTAQTAQPLADLLKLPLVRIPAADTAGLVARLRASDPQARPLVVSHGDRLPILLRDLGDQHPADIPGNQYDDLFVVLPGAASRSPVVLRLHY